MNKIMTVATSLVLFFSLNAYSDSTGFETSYGPQQIYSLQAKKHPFTTNFSGSVSTGKIIVHNGVQGLPDLEDCNAVFGLQKLKCKIANLVIETAQNVSRVSQGDIYINDNQIVDKTRLNKNTKSFELPVALQLQNSMSVKLKGSVFSFVTIEVLKSGDTPVDLPPVAVLNANPLEGISPLEVTFDGSSSSDIEGDITFHWQFEVGATSSLAIATHTYNTPGSYTATLTVTDSIGQTATASTVIEVLADTMAPSITISSPTEGQVFLTGNSVGIQGSSNEPLLSATVNGQALTLAPNGLSFEGQFSLSQSGSQSLEIVATDLHNNNTTINRSVYIDSIPQAVLIADPISGVAPLEVQFNALSSMDIEGPISYLINFGDSQSSSLPLVSHIYNQAGNYTATLTVIDSLGQTHIVSQVIEVLNDTTAPVLTVNSPQEGQEITNSLTVNIVGSSNEVLQSAEVNGQALTLSQDGLSFSGNYTHSTYGPASLIISALDLAGNPASQNINVNFVEDTNLAPQAILNLSATSGEGARFIFIDGRDSIDPDGEIVSYEISFGDSSENSSLSHVGHLYQEGSYTVTLTITDNLGKTAQATQTLTLTPQQIPVDPATIAPPLPKDKALDLLSSTSFLYEGANPIQTGLNPASIDKVQAAVIRGRILDENKNPLPGVKVTVLNHPEYGQTFTRADGEYDMVINGGAYFTLNFEKGGYLPAQRARDIKSQNYNVVKDTILIGLDEKVTTISPNQNQTQIAVGTTESDIGGPRTARLVFPKNTTASMILPNGQTQQLQSLNVRMTEYTVGEDGPTKMPAELPRSSAYTYAVELSVDEAIAAGATSVQFNKPVSFYVDNFLNFPVGSAVPVGYFDRKLSKWIPSENGRIIEVSSVDSGVANLIIGHNSGEASTAELAALGIDESERQTIAAQYSVGKSFWRVQSSHFSPWDLNYSIDQFNQNTVPPKEDQGDNNNQNQCSNNQVQGSIVNVQSQLLGEKFEIAGTPFSLYYWSDRMPGFSGYKIKIPLIGTDVPEVVPAKVKVEIEVMGQRHEAEYAFSTNLDHEFIWNGEDQFGRKVAGPVPATVKTSYGYVDSYALYGPVNRTLFGATTNFVIGTMPSDRLPLTFVSSTRTWNIGGIDARSFGLGGWTLDVNHSYFPASQKLMFGSGSDRDVEDSSLVAKFFAGTGVAGFSGDGDQALNADLNSPAGLSVAPDGSLYIVDEANLRIRKVDPNGVITTFAGNGSDGSNGDGGLATSASLNFPLDIEVGLDGDVFVTESDGNRIRKINKSGIIDTFAGTGAVGYSGDGGLAKDATLSGVVGLVVDKDGSVFFSERNNHVIRRVNVNGIIETIAGTGNPGFSGDGAHASLALLNEPLGMAIDREKNIYFVDSLNHRIRKIREDGTVVTIAGNGSVGFSGDGALATEASFHSPIDVEILPSGELIISDNENARIRKVLRSGLIITIAGTDLVEVVSSGSPSTLTNIGYPRGLAADQYGHIYFSDESNRVWKLEPLMPRYSGASFSFAQNNQVLLFDEQGLHLETRSLSNGTLIYSFSYDLENRLASITDVNGRVTTVVRNGDGSLRAIISPDGLETILSENSEGYLDRLSDPEGGFVSASYGISGLMATFRNKKGGESTFGYNQDGRLITDSGPNGGELRLAYSFTEEGRRELTLTSPEGVNTSYSVTASSDAETMVNRNDDGMGRVTISAYGKNGYNVQQHPSGLVIQTFQAADPIYGMSAPYIAYQKISQGGSYESITSTTLVVDKNATTNSPERRTAVSNINGETYVQSHNLLTNVIDNISPEIRTSKTTLNEQNRISILSHGTLQPVGFNYNSEGRLFQVSQGDRSTLYTYDGSGYISSIRNALSQTTTFENDLMGRPTKQTLPDGREIRMVYDDAGNMISISPPGKPQHDFVYDLISFMTEYLPPSLGGGPTNTVYTYNRDKQMVRADLPDGRSITYEYNPAGQLITVRPSDSPPIINIYNVESGNLIRQAKDRRFITYGSVGSLVTSELVEGEFRNSINYGYNSNLNLASISIDGSTINLKYDKDQLHIGDDFLTISRNENGLISGSLLNGNSDVYTYNSFGEVESYTSSHYSVTYTRDNLGRITNESGLNNGVAFNVIYDYDLSGRLSQVTNNGSVTNYSYDANSNRVGGTYDDQDRLLSQGDFTYTYTDNGELKTKTNTSTSELTTYSYDVFGNLRETSRGENTISYELDARNRRIGRWINGTLEKGFLYKDQLNPIAEINPDSSIKYFFLYGSKPNVPDYMLDTNGTIYRIISNHLGSVRLVVNTSDNSVTQQIDYDVWGNITSDTNPGFQPFGFAGGIYDEHTGLTRFGARDYDPVTARWTAKDPIRFDGRDFNLYGYTLNDPVNNIDPTGKIAPIAIGAVFGGIVGGLVSGVLATNNPCASGGDIAGAVFEGALFGAIGGAAATLGGLGAEVALTSTTFRNALFASSNSGSLTSSFFSSGFGLFESANAGLSILTSNCGCPSE